MAWPELDGYRIVEKVHSGAIADVYRARSETVDRIVILKMLRPSILPTSPFARALEQEARLLAQLSHQSIPKLFDYVRTDTAMCLVLENTDGWTLAELLSKLGPLPPRAAAAVGLEVAKALAHAHRHGVVHRAVQPANVLVSLRGEVKLMEFSTATDDRLPTAPELAPGAGEFAFLNYLSPEQILGEPADPRSDLFSLGVVLYEALTGKRPFDAPDSASTSQAIRHDTAPPFPRELETPAALERVVFRCLCKLPGDRFATASELVLALEAFVVSPAADVLRVLHAAGLTTTSPDEEPPVEAPTAQSPLRSAVVGLTLCAVALVGGAVVIRLAATTGSEGPTSRTGARLELAPERPGYLRVVATPWAEVFVDGQRIDTTPFARPIPLRAGTHWVRFEHPAAPHERREIVVAAGATVLLDVTMRVPAAPATAAPTAPEDAGSEGARASP